MRFFRDFSLTAATAGFVAMLVGITSSIAVVFQAARSFGADDRVITSWLWAIFVGMSVCTIVASLWWRKPFMVAWSTPGAAVLAAAGAGYTLHDAVGAFMVAAGLVVLVGATGWFERSMDRIPVAIASALLAGVLARFGLQAFSAAGTDPVLVVAMLLAYLGGRRLAPRYAVLLTLLVAVVVTALQGRMVWSAVHFDLARPVFVAPAFGWQATVSLALPLFIVTMASQNLPGVAAIRTAGYDIPISRGITITGLATLVMAPFGGYSLNLSAITAAMCMGREAHVDPARRYVAAVCCGLLYLVIGIFGAAVTGVLTAFPTELVAGIAGLALLGSIGGGLAVALQDELHREAALITFLVTLSGVVMAGIGSAFWGVVAGGLALFVQQYRPRPRG